MYSNSYSSYGSYASAGDTVAALLVALIPLVIVLLCFIAWCKLFRKANLPWERLFVPIYGSLWMYKIAECGYIFWLGIVLSVLFVTLASMSPDAAGVAAVIYLLVMLILHIVYCCRLAKAYGKGGGFAFGLIVLHPLFIMILGFGSAEYRLGGGSHYQSNQPQTWTCRCGAENPVGRSTCGRCGAQKTVGRY